MSLANRFSAVAVLFSLTLLACSADAHELIRNRRGNMQMPDVMRPTDERMAQLKLPPGFRINRFADDLGAPRMMAVGEDGTVYVTRRRLDDVLALADRDGDGVAEEKRTVVSDLNDVHGIALHGGRMYLATIHDVYVGDLKDGKVGRLKRILTDMPPGGNHPNRTLAIGPDGRLYVTVGSTCNCCVEENEESATILVADADSSLWPAMARCL